MATTNGSTAIRDKILASLARYRALRIGKFPCAFWRLSARPGLTAREDSLAREIRLMALLEHKIDTIQSETSSDKPVIRGVFSKLFK
ncbi:hypothetical protein [Bathymodiolus japonicus methanotrophic gill symbiont]|uniref:hypothetical protein n=1 Tax=Bathymodiolus japonicus methanotrophic gill symbiont TaxID=113269 RepID=UPI001C8DD210|nr:hypothetical protein [Bathymodiolus japonicus methanotrophic gill symbiont]